MTLQTLCCVCGIASQCCDPEQKPFNLSESQSVPL